MTQCVFFYGTLLTEFGRCRHAGINQLLSFRGHGSIAGSLYDLGLFPAAVPSQDGCVWGDVYCTPDPDAVLARLDEIEGAVATPDQPDASLYTRVQVPVTLDDGTDVEAWVYFYNAPLGRGELIVSGDYREFLQGKRYP